MLNISWNPFSISKYVYCQAKRNETKNFTPKFKAKVVLEAFRGESSQAERIAYLEQLVGRLTVGVDIHERALNLLSGKTYPDTQDGNDSPE